MDNKHTICLITNWYPNKKNPVAGGFLKEQAFATADRFDYIVVHYTAKEKNPSIVYLLKCLMGKTYHLEKINKERNTVEYNLTIDYPVFLKFANTFYDNWVKHITHKVKLGVGRYVAPITRKSREKALHTVFKNEFQDKIDVLYCPDAQNESATLRYISESLNIPFIVSEHAPVPWPGTTISDEQHDAIEHADCFLAISYDKIRQVWLQNIKLRKYFYIGNMVQESQFHLRKGNNAEKTFITVAAHSFYKNYDLFIRIMNRLTELAKIPFKVMIVGYAANKGYSENVEEFENQIKASKFCNVVEMIPSVPHDQVHNYLERADAYIMTSIQEGQPVSAMEAAICGLPIFSTRCGGVEDYVDDSIGRIFPVCEVQEFAKSLNEYLTGAITFDSGSIREKAIKYFGEEAFRTKFMKVFDETIKRHGNC